jgi:hypothetical protein
MGPQKCLWSHAIHSAKRAVVDSCPRPQARTVDDGAPRCVTAAAGARGRSVACGGERVGTSRGSRTGRPDRH